MSSSGKSVYQFKVTLRGIKPQIWRRIQVPDAYSFWDLHVAIQDAMGWWDCHLHAFRIPRPQNEKPDLIGIPDEDGFVGAPQFLPGWEVPIADYFSLDNPTALYEYDFGDSWEHEITFEKVLPRHPRIRYPICIAGRRRCPPEDCGGPPGFEDILKILKNPKHEEYAATLTWVGGSYDPASFDPAKVKFDNPGTRWRKAFQ